MKKVLSFVLVLAMVLGSVAMVFAADFTDQASITNEEASKVLSAAGIIEGYTDGSFKPTQTLTRAEGAAILARMMLGKADAAKLTTVVSPFNDVPATHWAAGYISYAVAQGYINGYGNGNFGPEDTLTVAAFGKMMLTAAGYKSANEGFTGDAWETNVGAVMVKAGLTDGVTITGGNSCTREVAAQVALNTLKADLVEYDGTPVTVSTGSVTVSTGQSAAKKVVAQASDKDGQYKAAGNGIQFMERYQTKLTYQADNGDAFGRPDTFTWRYDNVKAFTKKDTKNLLAKYTTKQTNKTLNALISGVDADKNATVVEVYVDGRQVADNYGFAAAYVAPVKNNTSEWKYDGATALGNGVQLEVFYDSANTTLTYVAYYNYLMEASSDYNANKGTLKVSKVSNMPALASTELDKKDFAVEGYKAEDKLVATIAYNGATYDIKSIAPVNKVTGTVSQFTAATDVTIDGTKYTVSKVAEAGILPNTMAAGNGLTLLLDPNGFVLKTTDEVSSNQYVFITAAATETGLADADIIGTAYFPDGTKSTIKIKKVDGATATVVNVGGATPNKWWNYSVDANGKYTLKTITNLTVDNETTLAMDAGKVQYKAGKAASAETIFIVKTANDTKLYTGYKAAPGTNAVVNSYALDKDGVAKYVWVDASATTLKGAKTTDYLFVYKTGTPKTAVDANDTYYTYGDAFLNGEKKTVEFTADPSAKTAVVALYPEIGYDSANGRVDSMAAAIVGAGTDGFLKTTTTSAGAISKAGMIELSGFGAVAVDDSAVAYIYSVAGDLSDAYTISQVVKNLDDNNYDVFVVYTNTNDKIAKTIFFVGLN